MSTTEEKKKDVDNGRPQGNVVEEEQGLVPGRCLAVAVAPVDEQVNKKYELET